MNRLDARTKIVLFLILLYWSFTASNCLMALLNLGFTILLAALTSAPIGIWTKCLARFLPMLVITFLLNLFFSEPGLYYEIAGVIIPVGNNSLPHSVKLVCQLTSAILLALALSFSTPPSAVTFALEWFATPLTILKIPTTEFSMAVFMAMRFIPIFQQELHKIREAQISRGIDFQAGSVLKKGKRLLGILHPAFISTIKRSDMLAQAMSSRGFSPGRKRSHFPGSSISKADVLAIVVVISCLLLITAYDHYIS